MEALKASLESAARARGAKKHGAAKTGEAERRPPRSAEKTRKARGARTSGARGGKRG